MRGLRESTAMMAVVSCLDGGVCRCWSTADGDALSFCCFGLLNSEQAGVDSLRLSI